MHANLSENSKSVFHIINVGHIDTFALVFELA